VGANDTTAAGPRSHRADEGTLFAILLALSFAHLLNDLIQSLIPAIYPILKESYDLTFTQVGLITLAFQVTASLLQPLVGLYTDRHPKPFSLAVGMGFTLLGLLLLAMADRFPLILLAAGLVGVGSSVFHPESSRMARVASGGRHGLAQSLFQVGGNAGSAAGPLLAAFIVVPRGQASVAWFSIVALVAIVVLCNVGRWYRGHLLARAATSHQAGLDAGPRVSSRQVARALVILLCLIFSKYFYLASLGSYYTFYLMFKFGVSIQDAQLDLFIFLGAVAAGTIAGAGWGPPGLQGGYLGIDPGSAALHLGAALREPVLDKSADRADRPRAGLGVLGDPGLRSAVAAPSRGRGGRPVFRPRFRHGRPGRRGAGQAG